MVVARPVAPACFLMAKDNQVLRENAINLHLNYGSTWKMRTRRFDTDVATRAKSKSISRRASAGILSIDTNAGANGNRAFTSTKIGEHKISSSGPNRSVVV